MPHNGSGIGAECRAKVSGAGSTTSVGDLVDAVHGDDLYVQAGEQVEETEQLRLVVDLPDDDGLTVTVRVDLEAIQRSEQRRPQASLHDQFDPMS